MNTNRPSRIVTNTKTSASLLPSAKPGGLQDVSDIPKLLNKILKISSVLQKDELNDPGQNKTTCKINKPQIPTAVEKKSNSLPLTSGRKTCFSQMLQDEKRPFSLKHRLSIAVKTTLNSPTYKKARKSLTKSRRSVAPAKSSTAKLFLSQTADKNIGSVNQEQKKPIRRQSLLPTIAASTTQLKTGFAKKADPLYTCSFCFCQFRIKSLLDAHKRSHEAMPTTTAMVKKIATLPTAALHSSTQCKYCDKKFAIVRALHIHLMENCLKIPPAEKRKLQFTEMNHVEKAQLPEFSNASSILTTGSKNLIKTNTNLSSTSTSSTELLDNKGKHFKILLLFFNQISLPFRQSDYN